MDKIDDEQSSSPDAIISNAPTDLYALIIDTDGGVDDVQALVAAFADGARTRVLGVTTVAGNASEADATRNVCAALAACGRADVPVFRGAGRPLVAEPGAGASEWHGADGCGNSGLGARASAAPVREGEHAALAIARLAAEWNMGSVLGEGGAASGAGAAPLAPVEGAGAAADAAAPAGSLPGQRRQRRARPTLVTLGPLTNVALALRLRPALAEELERVVVMAGAYQSRGNTGPATPAAEFNALADPEALAVVLAGFPRVQLVTWELTLRSGLPLDVVECWLGRGGGGDGAPSARASYLAAVSEHLIRASRAAAGSEAAFAASGFYIPDPLAMIVALRPEAVTVVAGGGPRRVAVALAPGAARGATLIDWDSSGAGCNVEVVERIDMGVVRELLLASTRT